MFDVSLFSKMFAVPALACADHIKPIQSFSQNVKADDRPQSAVTLALFTKRLRKLPRKVKKVSLGCLLLFASWVTDTLILRII